MPSRDPLYKRILLKLSGEALMGDQSFGMDASVLDGVAMEIAEVHRLGVQVGIVIGGGNIFRGIQSSRLGVGRIVGDQIGMLATIINSLALSEALRQRGCETRVMSAIDVTKVAEPYILGRAVRHLTKNRIVLFGAGTGNPYFTTDTAAALRALEIDADALLKATKVDMVYGADPVVNPDAEPLPVLTHQEVLQRNLQVMDLTAVSLAMGRNLPIWVFNLKTKGNLQKIMIGEQAGTLITGEEP
jgi:uridylate kinase